MKYIVRTVRIPRPIRKTEILRRALDLAIARSAEGLHIKSNACCVYRVLIRSAIAIFASGRVRVLVFLAKFCYSDTLGKLTGTCKSVVYLMCFLPLYIHVFIRAAALPPAKEASTADHSD